MHSWINQASARSKAEAIKRSIPTHLPFVSKTTTKPNSEMNIEVVQADLLTRSDFRFVTALIEALKKLPIDKGVFFPKIEGGLARAELLVHLDYDDARCAAATLIFVSVRQQLQMNYYAKMTMTKVDGTPALRLTMMPNGKLKKEQYRSTEQVVTNYADALTVLFQNLNVGSAYRKIGPLLFGAKK